MIFEQLITSRVGGGAIGVVSFGLAGGCALSGRGRAWWRRTCGSLAVLSLLLMLVMASDWAPLGTAHGLWVGLYAASLRAFMWEVAGDEARADWAGTFAWVLLPGAIIDTLLGWAEHRRWTDTVPHRCWLAWSPMLFEAVLLQNPLDLLGGSEGGIGLAAVAVPAICMIGGYAIARCGPRWVRSPCGLVALSAIPIWSMTATGLGGSSMSLGDHHGAWAAVLYWGLLATFSMTAAIPNRRPVLSLNRPACPPAAPSESAPTMTT